jgi:hypothetical protein
MVYNSPILTTGTTTLVEYVHRHNRVRPDAIPSEKRFGIRVTLPEGDTFSRLLGPNWEQLHWFATEEERDRAFERMAIRHGYYRKTDTPTQVLEKIIR